MRASGAVVLRCVVAAVGVAFACDARQRASEETSPATTASAEPVTAPRPVEADAAAPLPPASAPPPGPPPPTLVVTTEELEVHGERRAIVVAAPSRHVEEDLALVLVFHGDGGDGPGMRAAYPIDQVAFPRAVVAYPSGLRGGWDLYAPQAGNADLALVDAVVAGLSHRFGGFPGGIFATGFSSGGFLANQIACRRSGLLRGIVVHSGGAPAEPSDPTASWWPNGYVRCAGQNDGVAAMVIHGTADPVVVLGSGDYAAKYWAYVNGCGAERAAAAPLPCEAHVGCPAARPVLYCPIAGMGHSIWASGVAEAWTFFASL